MPKLTKLEPQKQSSDSGRFYWITGFILFFILFVVFDGSSIINNIILRLCSASIFREITGITSPVKVMEVDTLVGFTGDGSDTIIFELTSQQTKLFIDQIESDLSWKKVSLEKEPTKILRPDRCKNSHIYYKKQIFYERDKHPSLKLKEGNIFADTTYTFCPGDLQLIYDKTYR